MAKKNIPKVSVLVPIYNVERYLRQCLDSLVNQTLSDIEIICINDGSTDGSPEIIEEYAKNDSRIVVVSKKNSGYGDSMNHGLEKARGEYIGIVESDDWIELDAFEKLYNLAKAHDAEVVRSNYYLNKNNKDTKYTYIDVRDAGRIIDPARHTWIFFQSPAIWSAIYERDFLIENNIKFLPSPGASYQDTGFNFKVWACAHKAFFTTEAFLHYRIDNESSSVNNPGKVLNVCHEYAEIEKFLSEKGLLDELFPIMIIAKLGAYVWNAERLSAKLLPDFIAQAQDELSKVPNINEIIDQSDTNVDQRKMMKAVAHQTPARISFRVKLRKGKQLVRNAAKKIWVTARPSYRKQLQLSELVAELSSEIDALEIKLRELEDR